MAKKLFDRLADGENYQELSLQPRVLNSKDFELIDFSQEQVVLCVFSTTGDGECKENCNLLTEKKLNFAPNQNVHCIIFC